ncbi:hypothetical protein Bca101_091357 [Brassica carinata]
MVDQLECWVWQASSKHIVPGHLEDSSIANKSLPRRDSMERLGFVRTLLIDNYNSYTFNIYQALSTIYGGTFLSFSLSVPNDEWTWEEAYCYLYEDTIFDNMVISPGHGSPMRLPWPSGTGLYLWRLCGACPGTSPWTVKSRRRSSTSLRLLRYVKPETGVDRILLDAESTLMPVNVNVNRLAPPA